MTETIGIIQGCRIQRTVDIYGKETVFFTADADIDRDGQPIPPNTGEHYDPDFQPDTSLHGPDGKPLRAYDVPYVVVPPLICQHVKGLVLGSECLLTNTLNGRQVLCVVGDIGPHKKIGEISPDAATAIAVNPNPRTGGESRHVIDYEIRVAKPALIDGVQYRLKPYVGDYPAQSTYSPPPPLPVKPAPMPQRPPTPMRPSPKLISPNAAPGPSSPILPTKSFLGLLLETIRNLLHWKSQ